MSRQALRRVRGFTLVELMVGLAVGLFVGLAAISIFVSTRTLQTMSSAESRRGENARLAMELLHKDFRSAGFQGCHSRIAEPPATLLNPGNGMFLDSGTAGMSGSRGNGASFMPVLNSVLSGLAQPPLANSDVVSLRVPVEPMALGMLQEVSGSDVPAVGANTPGNTIVQGDILLIANCKSAAIFQVTAAAPSTTGVLTRDAGGAFAPGNAATALPLAFNSDDSALYRLQTHHYYIAASVQRAGTTSMWRFNVPNTDGSPNPQEVAQGIDRMQITYGIDSGEQTVSRYVGAQDVASWNDVVAARIQLLTATVQNNVALGAQSASFAGSTVVSTDRRLRTQVTEVIALRNRAP